MSHCVISTDEKGAVTLPRLCSHKVELCSTSSCCRIVEISPPAVTRLNVSRRVSQCSFEMNERRSLCLLLLLPARARSQTRTRFAHVADKRSSKQLHLVFVWLDCCLWARYRAVLKTSSSSLLLFSIVAIINGCPYFFNRRGQAAFGVTHEIQS